MLRWFEHSQVYHPDRILTATGKELGRPLEDVLFKAGDGVELNGWFYPASKSSARKEWVILFCHGNAGNLGHRLETASVFLETGTAVFVFDYRGYGHSQGRPSEEGTYLDAAAAHQWLMAKGFAGKNIIAFGESLGGAVACELALHSELGGLVLQSTFTSIPDIGAELFPWLPVRWLSTLKYDTRSKLPSLKLPVLVMHGRGDELIRFHHGQKNFAAANEPKLFWEIPGGHNESLFDRACFVSGLEKFIRLVERAQARPAAPNSPP